MVAPSTHCIVKDSLSLGMMIGSSQSPDEETASAHSINAKVSAILFLRRFLPFS